MTPRGVFMALILCCLIAIGISPAQGQWVDQGTAICTAPEGQDAPRMVSDGLGGLIIVWQDSRGDQEELYAQRLDKAGHPLWAPDGIVVDTTSHFLSAPTIQSDGEGGAIILWQDASTQYDTIYAQRINRLGSSLWGPNGVCVSTVDIFQGGPQLIPDGRGGALITWYTYYGHGGTDIVYAQRVDAGGNVLWSPTGLIVCNPNSRLAYTHVIPDCEGGAIITWGDSRDTYGIGVYAQRVDQAGNMLWAKNGLLISTRKVNTRDPQVVTDGRGGAIIAWQDMRNGSRFIYAQRVDGSGTLLWANEGIPVCSVHDWRSESILISDGNGGAIVGWDDVRSEESDVHAQKIDGAGKIQWTTNGVAICTASDEQSSCKLVSDGSGGAIISWRDHRRGNWDVYAQRVDHSGKVQWTQDGLAVCGAPNDQSLGDAIANGTGSVVLAWSDDRGGTGHDVYAQRIQSTGNWGVPGATFGLRNVPEALNRKSKRRTVNAILSPSGSFTVSEILGESVRFDGLNDLAPESWSLDDGNHHARQRLVLKFQRETIQELLPIGNDVEVWLTGELVSGEHFAAIGTIELCDPGHAGKANPGSAAQLGRAALVNASSGSWLPGGEDLNSVEQATLEAYPNPFNPRTSIRFELARAGRASLRVFDVSGRLVAILVDEQLAQGSHTEEWDGRDLHGQGVGSGVYYYQLKTQDFVESKRMVLLK